MAGKNVIALLCVPAGLLAASWCVFSEGQKPGADSTKGKDATMPVAARNGPVENDAKIVTDDDNGKKVKITRGGKLTVKLKAQLGTGYSWTLASNDEKKLKPEGKPKIESAGDAPGAVERQVFQFKAVGTGVVALKLDYKQPFDKEAEPAKTFTVNVEITDP